MRTAAKQGRSYSEPPIEEWREILEIAAKEVLSMMAGLELSTQPIAVPLWDVTAMVGLAGELRGRFLIRCSATAAEKLAINMLGDANHSLTHRYDAVGEICNIVAGHFKAKIDGLEDGCMLSVPTVIAGANYQVHSPNVKKRIEMGGLIGECPMLFTIEISP